MISGLFLALFTFAACGSDNKKASEPTLKHANSTTSTIFNSPLPKTFYAITDSLVSTPSSNSTTTTGKTASRNAIMAVDGTTGKTIETLFVGKNLGSSAKFNGISFDLKNKRVLFVARKAKPKHGELDQAVFTLDLASKKTSQLTDGYQVVASPDGTKALVATFDWANIDPATQKPFTTVEIFNLKTKAITTVVSKQSATFLGYFWSKDSTNVNVLYATTPDVTSANPVKLHTTAAASPVTISPSSDPALQTSNFVYPSAVRLANGKFAVVTSPNTGSPISVDIFRLDGALDNTYASLDQLSTIGANAKGDFLFAIAKGNLTVLGLEAPVVVRTGVIDAAW